MDGFGQTRKGKDATHMKRALLAALFSIVLTCLSAHAQSVCPSNTKSDKLACLVTQVYGISGMINPVNPAASGQFSADFLTNSLNPVQSSIARQSALLPLASPSSGITFSWDPSAKAFITSTDSFGPILGERAETIGKYRVYLGFTYQNFHFNTIDGMSLNTLPVLLSQPDDSTTFPGPGGMTCSATAPATSANPSSFGQCGYIRDVIKTANNVDLKIHQFTTFITFGLTNRIDVSVAIPIENVRMKVTSNATIVHNDSPSRFFHAFPPSSDCPAVCLQKAFSDFGTASGIADVTLRVKGTAWKGERAALALGVDVRVPTGQQFDFLGSGATGVKPFVVWSYRSRISPHALVGYEVNGSSVIGGSLTTGTKDRLPSQLTYTVGADVWLTKWLTGAFDIVGQQVFQARESSLTTVHDVGQCQDSQAQQCDPTIAPLPPNSYQVFSETTGTYNISNASVGFKMKPFSNLLITGNVLIKLNDGGLRSNFVPLVGLSYTF
jgi:outer membrane putative beta-barrel porin/alpha-amylase